ncbi:MAG: TetR family transcriptional regulator [Enterocloster sp.]
MSSAEKSKQKKDTDPSSTKEKLINAGIRLFSEHGFEATTTRMLADAAGANNAAVYFHFGTKEHLYSEVLNTVAKNMKITFQPLKDEIEKSRSKSPLSPQQAWIFIEKYVDMYIDILKNPDNNTVLYLLLHEQTNPADNSRPITRIACQEGEQMLVHLLFDYWQIRDHRSAAIVSRLLTSSLIALSEHPSFVRIALGMDPDVILPKDVWQTIRDYSLTSLRAFKPAGCL